MPITENCVKVKTDIEWIKENISEIKYDMKKVLTRTYEQPKICNEEVGTRLTKRDDKIDKKVDKPLFYWATGGLFLLFIVVIGYVKYVV